MVENHVEKKLGEAKNIGVWQSCNEQVPENKQIWFDLNGVPILVIFVWCQSQFLSIMELVWVLKPDCFGPRLWGYTYSIH